jgi:UTP--glucose-1-phosphate uridylyltransferase
VQYVVEELARAGVEQILFVTGRGKDSIENHFDHDPELAEALRRAAKNELLDELDFEQLKVHYLYTRQSVQRGLGDAILCGEPFVGQDPFLVALGDSIIGLNGQSLICRRLAETYEEERAAAVIAVEEVPEEDVRLYGVVKPETDGEVFRISNLVEKPTPSAAPSRLAIVGRYVFSPVIFDLIRRTAPDQKHEVQLTEAIRLLCETGRRVLGVRLPPGETRYDIGNYQSYFETFTEFALADPQHGPRLRERLRRLLGGDA